MPDGDAGKVQEVCPPQELPLTDRRYIGLMVMCALVGVVAGLLVTVFFSIVTPGINFLWTDLPEQLGVGEAPSIYYYTIGMCLVGGLIVGLIVKYTKEPATILAEEMDEVASEMRMAPRKGIVNMVRGMVALIFGGAVGPEGPLVAGSGAVGTWLGERQKLPKTGVMAYTFSSLCGVMGTFFGSPFAMPILTIEGSLEKGKMSWRLLLPGIIAATTGYAVFYYFTKYVFGGEYIFPPYEGLALVHLLYAVLLGAIGAGVGLLFIYTYQGMRRASAPFKKYPLTLGLVGGLVLGVIGSFIPLVMFSGEHQIQEVIDDAAEMGVLVLLFLALLKIFLSNVCISTGWAGGYIFPLLFSGLAMGMAVSLLLPFIPAAVCMVCVMGGAFVAVLKSPIAVAMITAVLFSTSLVPVTAVAVVTAVVLTFSIPLIPNDVEGGKAGS
ncbi:MAG: chloride channel protein [Methanomassiliicoccales archaeon]|nr:chloride channel protein [Methanomassiliicoccales archaeon]